MDLKQTILGVVLAVVFWVYQMGYLNSLGTTAWFLASIILVAVFWMIGKAMMPKPSASQKEFWMFVSAFVIVFTFIISYLGPYLGAVLPTTEAGAAAFGQLVLSFWLIVFGAGMFASGWEMKQNFMLWTGLFWLFSAMHFVTSINAGPNSYLHFGLVVGLPFIIYGLVTK